MSDVTYQRPIKGRLLVRLDNKEEWEATPEDLQRFGYLPDSQRYDNLQKVKATLWKALVNAGLVGRDDRWSDTRIEPVVDALTHAAYSSEGLSEEILANLVALESKIRELQDVAHG